MEMTKERWKWVAIFMMGVVGILLVRGMVIGNRVVGNQEDSSVSAASIQEPVKLEPQLEVSSRRFSSVKVSGREPDFSYCETGSTITPPMKLVPGIATIRTDVRLVSGYSSLCRVNLVDMEGNDVSGGYNGIMVNKAKQTSTATWVMRIEREGNYIAQLGGDRCQWSFGLSQ